METNHESDIVKRAIRDTVRNTVIASSILADFTVTLRTTQTSVFLTDQSINMLLDKLTVDSGTQAAVFDFLVEFKYYLLTHGLTDENIRLLVESSISTITNSIKIPDGYKSLAINPISNKQDMFLCLLYLLRVNVVYVEEMIVSKQNIKEKSK